MPALAYAALIRIVRSLEESELYPHEVDILRGAADARLLADQDREERMADADELLGWLVESERVDPQVALLVREQLQAITSPAATLSCGHVVLPPPARRQGSLLGRAVRAILGLPVAPAPAPRPLARTQPAAALPRLDGEVLDDATLAALAALDELEAAADAADGDGAADAEVEAVDASGRPFDPDRLHEQAESLLAFHAWLDENDRR
jgi:hypothetical protein